MALLGDPSATVGGGARANGIDRRTLNLNAWRLDLERTPRPSELRLVELVAEESVEVGFRVECGPFVVEVPPGFDEGALARLLGVVATC